MKMKTKSMKFFLCASLLLLFAMSLAACGAQSVMESEPVATATAETQLPPTRVTNSEGESFENHSPMPELSAEEVQLYKGLTPMTSDKFDQMVDTRLTHNHMVNLTFKPVNQEGKKLEGVSLAYEDVRPSLTSGPEIASRDLVFTTAILTEDQLDGFHFQPPAGFCEEEWLFGYKESTGEIFILVVFSGC